MSATGEYRHLTAEEFIDLEPGDYTLVDLREEEDLKLFAIDEALHLPFSKGFGQLDLVPEGKPVIVFCKVGAYSDLVAQILAERGYDAATLDGGINRFLGLYG